MVSNQDKAHLIRAVMEHNRPRLSEVGGEGIGKIIGQILVIAGLIFGIGHVLWPYLIY
jgi:hypothetical protein